MSKMRLFALLVVAVAFALLGCATGARRITPVAHLKPDVSVITRPVSAARASTTRAANGVAEAVAHIEGAASTAKAIAFRGTSAGSNEAKQLVADLEKIRVSLFRVQAELRETAQKLDVADLRIAELDRVLDSQTRRLNAVEAERADAFDKNAELTKANAQLRRAAWWSKLKAWAVGAGLLGLVGLGFAFKVIGAGARIAAPV